MKNPHKYPKTMHWPWSQSIHNDDRIHHEPEYFVGKEVIITEKIDGSNSCLFRGNVYARSTGLPSGNGWHAMVKKHHAWKTFNSDMAFYGEDIFGVHSIEYDPIDEGHTWHLFAVRDGDRFISWDDLEVIAHGMRFPIVPILARRTFDSTNAITEFFENHMKMGSHLGETTEGCVMRIADEFHAKDFGLNVAKYVRANHVQTDEHWTKNWKTCKLKDE